MNEERFTAETKKIQSVIAKASQKQALCPHFLTAAK